MSVRNDGLDITCTICGGLVEQVTESVEEAGSLEPIILSRWWSHDVHPLDGHDAVPDLPHLGWPRADVEAWLSR